MTRLSWLPLLLLAACGYADGYRASVSLSEVTCEKAFTCATAYPDDAAGAFADQYGSDQDACVVLVGPDPADRDAWDEGEDGGRITYDKDAAKACADALEATSCEDFWSTRGGDACAAVLTGNVAKDGTCSVNAECTSGACRDGFCD